MMRRIAGLRGVAELDVLDVGEVGRAAADVHRLRSRWRRRSPSTEFYTLGGNAYMDLAGATAAQKSYFGPAQGMNAFLDEHFGALYERLADRLGEALALNARYPDDLARPGFHIWLGASIPQSSRASLHFDLQYLAILSRPGYSDCSGTVSFTVPVQLPANGSGLHVWPWCTYPAAAADIEAARRCAPSVVGYRPGTAVVHSGHLLHQVGATQSPRRDDVRMTLQGHGLVRGDELLLYW